MKKEKKIEKEYDVVQSFNHAIDGIFEAIREERHMKFHGFVTAIAIIVAIYSNMNTYEILFLAFAIMLVWIAELFNTAVEAVVDLATEKYHPLAKKAKDVAAGAVLISGLNAIFTGYLLFQRKIAFHLNYAFVEFRNSFYNSVALIIVIIVITVIILKYIFKKGTPLRGGIPSGHSALGGGAFIAITFLTINTKISFLAFLMLLLILQSRVEGKIHTVKEVILGASLGMGITYLFLRGLGF